MGFTRQIPLAVAEHQNMPSTKTCKLERKRQNVKTLTTLSLPSLENNWKRTLSPHCTIRWRPLAVARCETASQHGLPSRFLLATFPKYRQALDPPPTRPSLISPLKSHPFPVYADRRRQVSSSGTGPATPLLQCTVLHSHCTSPGAI